MMTPTTETAYERSAARIRRADTGRRLAPNGDTRFARFRCLLVSGGSVAGGDRVAVPGPVTGAGVRDDHVLPPAPRRGRQLAVRRGRAVGGAEAATSWEDGPPPGPTSA